MENYFKYIGLKKETREKSTETNQKYSPAQDKDLAERHLSYLKEIDNYQKERRIAIENKNSQLVGQASIVTSIFSLFVPLLLDSFNDISILVKIPLILIFLVVLFHYLLTIFHATKTLKINRYKYATRKSSTITKTNRATTELDFLNEEISDLVYTVNQTSPIDNIKGENLILGARCFEIANFGFGILTVLIIISAFFISKETPEIKIKNLQEINLSVPDSISTSIINLKNQDTVIVRIDSLKYDKKPAHNSR